MNELFKNLDYTIYPSDEKCISVKNDENSNNTYYIKKSLGYINNKIMYIDEEVELPFVQYYENDEVRAGLQEEQLIYVLMDRVIKLNNLNPNEKICSKKLRALREYLKACKLDIDNLINR